jgi:hypothetical protein
MIIGLILFAIGHIILGSTLTTNHYDSSSTFTLRFAAFLLGFGTSFVFISVLINNVRNFTALNSPLVIRFVNIRFLGFYYLTSLFQIFSTPT